MDRKKQDLITISIGEEISPIDRIVDGYKTYQVFRAALELNLFDWLDEHGPASIEEIGRALSINGMFARSFFSALAESGYLSITDDRFGNTGLATRFLVSGSPEYQGDWILNAGQGTGAWNRLHDALVKTAAENTGYSVVRGPQFIRAMGQQSLRGEVQGVVKILMKWEDFGSAARLLDIGGGHGIYAIAACQQNPGLHAVVFDMPHLISQTRENIREHGMEDRITVTGGDILTGNPGTGYDIVLVSHMLYRFRDDLPSIFKKVEASLRPRGLFVSNHWFCGPVCGAGSSGIRELDRSLHSSGHPLCHPEEFAAGMFMKGLVVTKNTTVRSIFGDSRVHVAEKVPEGESPLPGFKESCRCEP